jgi:acyl-CoA thioester hydrolase
MRWADLDQLGHVNNVVYVDYLQEARVDMLRTHGPAAQTGELAEGVVVVRHEVSYLSPLPFDFGSVSIESWVTEIRAASFTIAYEVFHERDGGARAVYLRAKTVLAPYVFGTERPRRLTGVERDSLAVFLEPDEPAPGPRSSGPGARPEVAVRYPVQVRFSDVDVYRHVNNVKYFEYFQEARLAMTSRLWEGLDRVALVVAQIDVDYRAPIRFRPEAYDAWTWVTRIGQRSATIDSLITDGDALLSRARVTIVFFDPAVQRSVVAPDSHREALRGVLA